MSGFLQLQFLSGVGGVGFKILLLCRLITLATFSMQLHVADLDTSPVEDLFEFVRFRKVSVEESEENLSNVGANTLTKRRVEPNEPIGLSCMWYCCWCTPWVG